MSLGDFDTSAVIYGKFTTYRPSTGAPYTLAGTPALSVYKDNSTTQSTTGVTLTVDFDSVTGLHHFAIDTSADTSFYSAGSFFDVVVTTGTVDSISAVGTVVGRFSLRKSSVFSAVDGIGTVGGSAVNVDATTDNYSAGITGVTSGTTRVGTQTNTYTSTSFEDSVYHTMTHSGNAIDIVYQFLTGGGTTPVGVRWIGYLTSGNDTVTVAAWNHVGGAWENIGSIMGTAGAANSTYNLTLFSRHSGTSTAELGKVYIRLYCTAQTSPVLNTDQLIVSYSVTSRTVGYSDGAVWIDTVSGVSGTEVFVNGVADNPCLTLTQAETIGSSLGLHNYRVANNSSITLAATLDNAVMEGHEWEIDFNGQSIQHSMFIDANVSGISTGTEAEFENCTVSTTTVQDCFFWHCIFKTTVTLGAAGDYFFIDCASGVAGSDSPVVDLGAAIGGSNVAFRRWSGGLTLNNVAAGDSVSVDVVSGGTITVNGTGGSVSIRGICNVVDGSGGAVTITLTSVLNQTTVASSVWSYVLTGTTTAVQAMRGFMAVLLGKASGLAGTTAVYRDVADTKDVITATVDENGNRTSVTRDLT